MKLASLSQVTAVYRHIYLSPHLDDAALSCGGVIAKQRASGEKVLVVTVCTAAPDPAAPFSLFAQNLHQRWGLDAESAVTARRAEDVAAMDCLDVDYLWLGELDAIYRFPHAYANPASLFSRRPSDKDPLADSLPKLLTALRAGAGQAQFYAPLSVGFHVDHQLTNGAAVAAVPQGLACYEDFPYVLEEGALTTRLGSLEGSYEAEVVPIGAHVETRIQAIGSYQSQLSNLFGNAAAMEDAVRKYAGSLAANLPAERLWWRL